MAHKAMKERREHEEEHQEFKKFMEGQKDLEKYIISNPPPQFIYNQNDDLINFMSEFEEKFEVWSYMMEQRLDQIEKEVSEED